MQKIIGIVAVAENLAIGKEGKIPWRYDSDLRFFKKTTSGNAIVMGYKTWLSIMKPLENRLNIVLSRTHQIENQPNLILMRSKEEVLSLRKYLNCDIFIIGGAAVYETFAKEIEIWLVTEIPLYLNDADTFMPKDFLKNFKLNRTEKLESNLKVKVYQR